MTRARENRRAGFTLVELLVAGAVLVTALGIATAFFAQQVQLQRAVQARNVLQDGVRVATQLVTQDLALAGNPLVVVPATGALRTGVAFPGCMAVASGGTSCLEVADVSATASTVRVRYVSSQFPDADACRDVAYRLATGVLQRSDVRCGQADAFVDLLPGVAAFKVLTVCSTGLRYEEHPVVACGDGLAYPRTALVTIGATSRPAGSTATPGIVVPTATVGATVTVPCPQGNVCFAVTQETLLPNLKDR